MKRILISLSIITVTAALVAGGTSAFFSDTETSANNIFTAGSIDLKIDHKSVVYNGENCEETCVEDTSNNLVLNGGFEVPEVNTAQNWDIFPNGASGLEWTVEWESTETTYNNANRPDPALVEYHEGVNAGWDAYEGEQYAELDTDWDGPSGGLTGEPALVRIYQDINTVSGQKYKIHYAYSPRPDVSNAADNELKVRINGNQVASHAQAGDGSGTTWTSYDYEFTASAATTKIEFAAGGTADSLGVFLDDVYVYAIDCTYELNGDECELWTETDLTDQRFFSFTDVKPGDLGKHVISLHVYDNDAYACMYTENDQDDDNGLTDPEAEVDTSAGPQGDGELSANLQVFVWDDVNADGLYQPTSPEPALAGPVSYQDLFIDGYGLDRMNLTATTTEYLGFAWCAGVLSVDTQGDFDCDGNAMGNVAQSDSLTADLFFYTEQTRNNEDFDCSLLREEIDT